MTTDILIGEGDKVRGAVLVNSRTLVPLRCPLFDDRADAEGFIEWLGRDPGGFSGRDLGGLVSDWRRVRGWPRCSCGVNGNRVEPGHEVCCDCECDAAYEAEQAAKGAA